MLYVTKYIRHAIKPLIAFCLLIASPIAGVAPTASASSMNGMLHMNTAQVKPAACASVCATTPAAIINKNELDNKDELKKAPEPLPAEPYFVQFQTVFVPRTIKPGSQFSSAVIRPPDILKALAALRF